MNENIEIPVVSEEEQVKEKPYTLRELCDEDLYPMLAIMGAVIPDDAKEAFSQIASGKKTVKEIGGLVAFDMCRLIMKNFKAVKEDLYPFLSDLSGIPAEEIKKMPFGTTPSMLKDIFEDAKNASFFTELFK